MESPILKLKKKKGPNLIILSRTKTILEEDVETHPEWHIINEWYKQTEAHPDVEWIDKATTSIINSIVFQNRAVFAVTLEKTRELLNSDKNWEKSIGIKNGYKKSRKSNDSIQEENETYYNFLYNKLVEAGVIEQVREQKHKEPRIYRVIDKDILNMLRIKTSLEDQEAEVIDFIDKNKGTTKGMAKGDAEIKKLRNLENERHSVNNSYLEDNDKKISFKQLLIVQFPDSFPSFDELEYLAQLAVENCDEFEPDITTMRTFEKHLKGTCKGKVSPKQKKYIDNLVKSFQYEAERFYNLKAIEGTKLKEPTEIKDMALKQEVNKEDVAQNNTLNILKATFGKDKMKVLKNRLENTQDEKEIETIKKEIEYWESIL